MYIYIYNSIYSEKGNSKIIIIREASKFEIDLCLKLVLIFIIIIYKKSDLIKLLLLF